MIWIQLLAYFVVCTVVLIAVFEVFAWLLRRIVCLARPFPLLIGILLYVIIACVFVLPLFGLEFLQRPYLASFELVRLVGGVGYLTSLLLAVLFFRHRHLDALKSLGYFRHG